MDAVSYAIVVIGEAAKAVPERVTSATPEIPWADIRGMRNRVEHEYFGIDVSVLWQTAREDLPSLLESMRALLARADLGQEARGSPFRRLPNSPSGIRSTFTTRTHGISPRAQAL